MAIDKNKTQTFSAPVTLDRAWVTKSGIIGSHHRGRLVLDLSKTERIDSAGVCLIEFLRRTRVDRGCEFVLQNVSPVIAKQLDSPALHRPAHDKVVSKGGVLERLGDGALDASRVAVDALSVFTEMFYWSTIGFFKRQDIKKGSLYEQMYQLGYKAVGIIALLSFLIGVVLSLQSAMQLKQLGLGIFLVPLIGITMIRQMGPLLTAIILAGRTGSATTAEIATMVVGEEVDALRTMGINPMQYIMAPKFWAISLTMPLLSIISTAMGIFGGYVIALLYLDMSTSLFMGELVKIIHLEHILAGCFKSMVFSWLIIWVGSYFGFRVRGGAEAVGRETTSSVVAGIFIIIVANALFSFIM
ncbi:MAG: MlaE family lipid ABC transporter permease subunit [Chitinispirillales bacterium]|jgi:phospholipid/cholesterol/gamma-HCH transport system permease protein|nr:MlaE family lipid ABC transporter permease subunit [Chitinispirillales bacterium]